MNECLGWLKVELNKVQCRHVVDSKCISENKKRSGNGHCEGDNGSYRMQMLGTSEGHGEDREGRMAIVDEGN